MGSSLSYEEEDEQDLYDESETEYDSESELEFEYWPRQPAVRRKRRRQKLTFEPKPKALYGEYKCICGYFWTSRLSWRNRYQECHQCGAHILPINQRKLRHTDFIRGEDIEGLEHRQHLCEMCKYVGEYCGNYKF